MSNNLAPQEIKARRDSYQLWSNVWWTSFLVFLVGGSFAAAFGSAFNFIQEVNHVLFGSIALIGGVCASISSALTPDKRADWLHKAYSHLDSAIIKYEQGLIQKPQLIDAMDRATDLSIGKP